MAEGLQLYLLGPPYVTWNGSILDIPRRQVRGLLYHLATDPNSIPQERLHYLLWEDKPEATCRRNLSQLLVHMRKILPDATTLVVKNSLVMLDHKNLWCDATEFRKLIRASKGKDQHMTLQRAVELYRGPYLDGVRLPGGREFEYVIERERISLERNYLSLLYRLILLEKNRKDYESAIEYAYLYLAVDNLCEDVHRQLISLFGLTGKRERAVEQYNICEDLLEKELKTKVSKKTKFMLHDVLSEKLMDREDSSEFSLEGRQVKNDPIFLRLDYLDNLEFLVNNRERGPWGIVLVRGELGIGKTSLLTKYLDSYKKKNLCLYTKCNPGLRSIIFWPIRQMCLSAGKSIHKVSRSKLDLLEDVEQVVVRLSVIPEDFGSSPNLHTMEHYFSVFFETIYRLADIAEGLILCIEDLEWADQSTLELILYISEHLWEKKILILGSYCCEENDNIRKFIHNIQLMDDYLGTVELHGVDLETTLSVLKYWLGDFNGVQIAAEKLHQMSAGNPLFLTEILRWVVESNLSIFDVVDKRSKSLPVSISNVIGFRLGLLEQAERKVLNAIAVKGYLSETAHISNQTELSVQQILDALDELVNHHFLEFQFDTYQFKHEIVRQSVLEALGPMRRQFLELG